MAEVLEKPLKKSEPLFSKRRIQVVSNPLNDSNPITVQILGICSALAVTVKLEPTLVMSISVLFVMMFSSLLASLLRNSIPSRIRIIVQLGIIAGMVIIVDQILKAYLYDVQKMVGVYVGLIITNCIVMGRLEAFALGNKPYDSVLDAIGNAMGYAWIILTVAFFRELLGSGTLFDIRVMPASYPTNGLMTSPVGAFIILGLIVWVQRGITGKFESH
jgi:Na+-transporting NADH:ubiquinone oxidoreductase subunit D